MLMVREFKFPDVGEGVTEGTLLKWLVKVGDSVKIDQPLAEIETDKAVVEVPAPEASIVLSLPWKQGDVIEVGKVLCVLGQPGEKYEAGKSASVSEKKPAADDDAVSVVGNVTGDKPIVLPGVGVKATAGLPSTGFVKVLPKVRNLARSLGVDVQLVRGTGKDGSITEADVRAVVSSGKGKASVLQGPSSSSVSPPLPDFSKHGAVEEVPLTSVRKAIAQHLQLSVRTAPHAVCMEEADVTDLWNVREKEKKRAKQQGIKLTFLPFIVKAVVAALKQFPDVNSSLDEQKQVLVRKKYYNLGIAVDSEHGLLVPVIKNADQKSILDIAREITGLAEKVRERKIKPDELSGGSFTLTNYGSIAGTFGVPVINYPEAAILGIGRIKGMPRFVDSGILGKNVVKERKILFLSLSFDHRIVDGAEAARFLQHVIKDLEDPDNLLVELG